MKVARLAILGLVVSLSFGLVGSAVAVQINDATLSTPFAVGSGNSSDHFAIDSADGVEVGLKAKLRYLGDVIPVGNTYSVTKGYQSDKTTYANWNFDFSLKLDYNPAYYTFQFRLDTDPSASQSYYAFEYEGFTPVFQDSWNYGMTSFLPGINANLDAIYDLELNVYDDSGFVAGSHIEVVVGSGAASVPEPGTFLLLGAGLAGLIAYRRKTKN